MPRQISYVLLGLVLQVPVVLLLFRTLPLKIAGGIAGALFCALSLWILILGFKDPKWRQGMGFWLNLPFLILFALPIWIMSLTGTGNTLVHWDLLGRPVFFVPLSILHHYARFFFMGLALGVAVDFLRAWIITRKKLV